MKTITLLDGGVGQEINKRSVHDNHPLWSVKVMLDAPSAVIDVHEEFIRAGAKVICLNTYTATPTRVGRDGAGVSLKQVHDQAIKLAKTAVQKSECPFGPVQIAGCLPPLVASYVSGVSKSYEASLIEYRQIVALQSACVDLFMIETMTNIAEASAALDAAKESSKPVILGLTVLDDHPHLLRSGESLIKAIAELAAKGPDAFVLNCSSPEAISVSLKCLAGNGVPFGAYANGFTAVDALRPGGTTDTLSARIDLSPQKYAEFAEQWVDMGATIVGGCCEVSAGHIDYLRRKLEENELSTAGQVHHRPKINT